MSEDKRHELVKKQGLTQTELAEIEVLDEPRLPAQLNERLQFRLAEAEDVPMLARITALAFDMPEEEVDWYSANVMERSDRFYYVGALDGAVIGKLDVQIGEEEEAFIF